MSMFKIPAIRPRGMRFPVPTGHIIGRVSPGSGDAEFIPLDQLANSLTSGGLVEAGPVAGGGGTALKFDLGVTIPSVAGLLYDQYLFSAIASADVTMPSAVDADIAKCAVASTTSVTFYLVNDPTGYEADGVTGIIATVAFTSGNTTGTITWASPSVAIARGDVLRLYSGPTFVDTAITGIELLFTADPA